MDILTFDEALTKTSSKRHLLLGNGFSIAWKSDIFMYDSIYKQSQIQSLKPNVDKLFRALNTKDFELVIKTLMSAKDTISVYSPNSKALIKEISDDAAELKELLVTTIASYHPDNPQLVSESEYFQCAQFLNNFNCVYTLNYDLLLYWVILHYNEKGDKVRYDDGFRTPDSGKADYVSWEVENTNKQNVHYLHGALHVFDAGSELQKYTWVNTGVKLIDQIRSALNNGSFPLFVSEGTSKEKKKVIMHHNYLSRAYRSFSAISGSLFIYGHSLADNDNHIINLIPKSKVDNVFVSLYGDAESQVNKAIIKKALKLPAMRQHKKELNLYFFDASSAKVWR